MKRLDKKTEETLRREVFAKLRAMPALRAIECPDNDMHRMLERGLSVIRERVGVSRMERWKREFWLGDSPEVSQDIGEGA